MKTFIYILFIGYTVAISSQNELNSNDLQQQVKLDSSTPVLKINTININMPYTAATQKVRTRGNSSNRYSPDVKVDNGLNSQNSIRPMGINAQKQTNIEESQVQLNTNLNVPSIKLNINDGIRGNIHTEKVSPKGLEGFRIKTGNSPSRSVLHKSQKENKRFQKKVLKPIKCGLLRTFKHTAKFQLSCACFQF